jgi:glycosyltransferase involved in cell wall biosynthesis
VKKGVGVLKGFLKRLVHVLFLVPSYDYIFIHREASPVGPPIFEFIISKIFRKKIIYDFDDAIWIPNTSNENHLVRWFKAFWKVKYICKWSYKVSAGNDFLCTYAKQFNKAVVLVPTSVDVEKHHNQLKIQDTPKIIIGWTGSHSTMKYLDDIVPVLKKISSEHWVEVAIISNKPPKFSLPNLRFIPWQESSEIQDLLNFNIGIMPLEDDAWSEGKCGFKLIQYMSLGIPAVASPVGVNRSIVDHSVNGFLCVSQEEWYTAIRRLIEDTALREAMGKTGRQKIADRYSVQANAGVFLGLFT